MEFIITFMVVAQVVQYDHLPERPRGGRSWGDVLRAVPRLVRVDATGSAGTLLHGLLLQAR